jgi:hypothetical protein
LKSDHHIFFCLEKADENPLSSGAPNNQQTKQNKQTNKQTNKTEQAVDEFGAAVWMDAGNLAMPGRFTAAQLQDPAVMGAAGFFSAISRGSIATWTHPSAMKALGMYREGDKFKDTCVALCRGL